MPKIDDLAQTIGSIADAVNAASDAAAIAGQEAQDAALSAEALGADDVAIGMRLIENRLDTLAKALSRAGGQATRIRVLTQDIAAGKGSGADIGAAVTDPADPGIQPISPPSGGGREGRPKRRMRDRVVSQAIDSPGDVGDVVSFFDKTSEGLANSKLKAPEPPQIISAGTQDPQQHPIATPSQPTGTDAPSIANAAVATGIVIARFRQAFERAKRAYHLPEQQVEEIPDPPPHRYPWE